VSTTAPPSSVAENRPAPKAGRFYVPQLDGLRFFAFLLVFFYHGPRMSVLFPAQSAGRVGLTFLQDWGWCGVDLFLVLSAYLITSLLLIEHEKYHAISLRGFYLRRILRIWPLYYLMATIGFFLMPWLGLFAEPLNSASHAKLMKDHFLAYYTLFGNYSSGAHGYPPVWTLAHLWTVTLEEQFYIVWPLILSLMLRLRRAALWALIPALLVGTICLRLHYVGHSRHPFIWTNTLTRLDPLLMGIALALWRRTHPPRPGWLIPILKLALGVGAVVSISWAPPIETQSRNIAWQFLATAAGFALILDAVLPLGRNPLSWFLSRRPLVWLGKLTYGLYVYHILGLQFGGLLVAPLQRHHWVKTEAAVLGSHALISFALTVAVAALSYRFFESFFLRMKDKLSRVKSRPVRNSVG
jgi:peptidoglycan/LPS O-acetylase OafA/YrhL